MSQFIEDSLIRALGAAIKAEEAATKAYNEYVDSYGIKPMGASHNFYVKSDRLNEKVLKARAKRTEAETALMKPDFAKAVAIFQISRAGTHGWPLTQSQNHPGELALTCPGCGSQNTMLTTARGARGTGPGGRWRMGDSGGQEYVKCLDCGKSSL